MDASQLIEHVRLAVTGDADALQKLIVHHHAGLRAALTGAIDADLRARIDPDDVLQNAYISAFKLLPAAEIESAEHFANWLKRIAFDRLKGMQRAHRRRKRDVAREASPAVAAATSYLNLAERLSGGEATPSRQMARGETEAVLMSCLARLGDDQREVVRLRFLEDVPVAEIAERLGKTETSVYTLCHRGLKSLHGLMTSITRYLSRGQ